MTRVRGSMISPPESSMRQWLCIAVVGIASRSANCAIVVDDFSTGDFVIAAPPNFAMYTPGAMLGGDRMVFVSRTEGAGSVSASRQDGPVQPTLTYAASDATAGIVLLAWGDHHALSLDVSATPVVRFRFLESTSALRFDLGVTFGAPNGPSYTAVNYAFPPSGAFDVNFDFSPLGALLQDVDRMHVTIWLLSPGEGFRLASVSWVPAPGTTALALLGFGAHSRRRVPQRGTVVN